MDGFINQSHSSFLLEVCDWVSSLILKQNIYNAANRRPQSVIFFSDDLCYAVQLTTDKGENCGVACIFCSVKLLYIFGPVG